MTRPFRLSKAVQGWWEVRCNLCGHTAHRHSRAAALHRLAAMVLRARILAFPLTEVTADRDELAAQVDMLAAERDDLGSLVTDLTDKLARAEQAKTDVRRYLRAAYEPVDVGDCRKIRHTTREGAELHAISVATVAPGDKFNVYECRVCPPYKWLKTSTRPFHVGHSRFNDPGHLYVQAGVLHYWCGCKFSTSTSAQVWTCTEHAQAA